MKNAQEFIEIIQQLTGYMGVDEVTNMKYIIDEEYQPEKPTEEELNQLEKSLAESGMSSEIDEKILEKYKLKSIEINKKLYAAITDYNIDYDYIADLLKQGADPLGPLEYEGETPLGELFCDAGSNWDMLAPKGEVCPEDWLTSRLPKIMEVFIQNGFDCSRLKNDVDGDHDLEMWGLTFSISEGECKVVQIMIENGLSVPPLEDFIGHFYTDSEMCDGSDMRPEYEEYLNWAFKTIMLCASYPRILEESEFLRDCIEMDSTNAGNTYDLCKFRNYNNYKYHYDLSTLDLPEWGMRNATVEVSEVGSDEIIWKMHI